MLLPERSSKVCSTQEGKVLLKESKKILACQGFCQDIFLTSKLQPKPNLELPFNTQLWAVNFSHISNMSNFDLKVLLIIENYQLFSSSNSLT